MNIPKDLDFIFFVNCLFLFMIAFLVMSFNDGESTISYINKYVPTITTNNYTSLNNFTVTPQNDNENIGKIMKYKSDIVKQNIKLPYIELFIYWLLLPLFNIVYGIWCYNKGYLRIYKSLKSNNNSNI